MISVCMATYNGERFLREQIDSILCQLGPEDELIISDDGSTDGTLGIIESYGDSRIRLLHHEKENIHINIMKLKKFYCTTFNFQNALLHAKGDFIFLVDQDDVWESNRIRIMVEQLKGNDLVMCNFSIIDNSGNIANKKFYNKDPISKYKLINIIKSKYIGCCMAFSRELLEIALPFPNNLMAHDYWIGCLSKKYEFIDIPLHKYRRHESNVSPSAEKSNNSFFIKIGYRVIFLFQIYKRMIVFCHKKRRARP
ncbi:MAG: glycosyltransferase [Spirochaetaceae bacterium]|nr:glycosyltransferase [Spirochaetaceae bacterium]